MAKRNSPFPDGLSLLQSLLRTCPEFGEIAAAGGLTAVQVLLKPAPAKPSKSKTPPHIAAGTVAVLNADSLGLLEAANGKAPEPMFRITIREDVWAKLTPRGREAFLYTCLSRMSVVAKDDADSDDTGYTCSLVSFPIQTFDAVLTRYGRWDQTEVLDEGGDEDEVEPNGSRSAASVTPDALASTDEDG